MLKEIVFTAFLVCAPALSFSADVQRTVKSENIGNITLTVPNDWKSVERHHIDFGTTSYRLIPSGKEFDLEILFNDLQHMHMTALVDKDLERYIESNMADAARQSTEGRVVAKRFGSKRDGVYARLTDKTPRPGEFVLFTQGVRLLGENIVLFTLYSNDIDGADLKKVLAILDSVNIEK